MSLSHDFVAAMGELVGTTLFLFLAEAGAKTATLTSYAAFSQTAGGPDSQTLIYVSLSFGLSLMVVAWMFFRISGSLFNPAISLALVLAGALPWRRAIMVVIAQFAGGIAAAGLVAGLTPGSGTASVCKLARDFTVVQGVFLEALLTSILVFCVLMLAAEKHRSTYLAPVGIGMTLFVTHLVGAGWTGAALNPARALGPSVVDRDFPEYHYIYYCGPFLGSLIAVGFYTILKAVDYHRAVNGQDADHLDGPGAVPLPTALYGKARRRKMGNPTVIQIGGAAPTLHPNDAIHSGSDDTHTNGASGLEKVVINMHGTQSAAGYPAATMDRNASQLSAIAGHVAQQLAQLARASSAQHSEVGASGGGETFIIVAPPEDLAAGSATAEAQATGAILPPGSTTDGLANVSLLKNALSQ